MRTLSLKKRGREGIEEEIKEKLSLMQGTTDEKLKELDIELKETALKVRNWEQAVEKGLSIDRAVQNINKLEHKRDALLDERSRITASMKEKTNIGPATNKMMGYLNNFRDVLDHGSTEEKKHFIRQFVKEIAVNPKEKRANIMFYKNAPYDIITGAQNCEDVLEINYP